RKERGRKGKEEERGRSKIKKKGVGPETGRSKLLTLERLFWHSWAYATQADSAVRRRGLSCDESRQSPRSDLQGSRKLRPVFGYARGGRMFPQHLRALGVQRGDWRDCYRASRTRIV